MTISAMLKTAEEIRSFALAGNAYLTLVSKTTGVRYTYRVRQPAPNKPHFVRVLTGEDNTSHYTFLGSIIDGGYRHSPKSPIRIMAPSNYAFDWFWHGINDPGHREKVLKQLEVWHEGRCGRCGRLLTVPESVAHGIGPECAGLLRAIDPIQHSLPLNS